MLLMKTASLLLALFLCLVVPSALAQVRQKPADKGPVPKPGESVVVERGAHHRVWKQARVATLPGGQLMTNVSSYTELGSGLHRWDGQNQQWVDAEAKLEIVGNNALGRSAAHQVLFAPNANTAGAIDFLTSDGKRLRSHVLGIAFFDAATGQSEMIGELKDSAGEMHAPNVVIYPDAFDGVKCDLRYTYRLDGFEQDVILYENPPLPKGFNSDSTRLEVWTEFIEAPASTIRQKGRAGMTDDTIDFGTMQTAASKVFASGLEQETKKTAPAAKRWHTVDGRTFLIEAVRLPHVKRVLDKLPPGKGHARANPPPPQNAPLDRAFPAAPPVRQARQEGPQQKFKLATVDIVPAKLAQVKPSLVLDYNLTTSLTDYTLKGDTTYVASNAVSFYGGTTIEGGCVVKFAKTNTAGLIFGGSVAWITDMYRPAIFTAVDDHTVGEAIGNGTLSGYYGGSYLDFHASVVVPTHLRLSHARTGISSGNYQPTIRHAQFVNCNNGLSLEFWASAQVNVENVLFNNVYSVFTGNASFYGTHITVNQAELFYGGDEVITVNLLNSVVIGLADGFGNGTQYLTYCHEGTDSSVFQTVGAGAHYLAVNSPHRNAGTTTGVSAGLLADLRKLTTYPPIVLSNYLTASLSLYPQAQRDTDTPDRGYHYPPLDFVFRTALLSNATITTSPGTAMASAGNGSYALTLMSGANFVSQGTPDNLNRFVRYNTVQEQANTNWTGDAASLMTYTSAAAIQPKAMFRFTEWSIPGGQLYHINAGSAATETILRIMDCQFYGGGVYSERPTLNFTNNLLHRVLTTLISINYDFNVQFKNCLFRGGTVNHANELGGTWIFTENLFDETVLLTNVYSSLLPNYNAYTTNAARLEPAGSNDVLLATSAIAYQAGPLGRFYLPTNSLLINTGSVANASQAGFYHHTMTTNQVKEATSRLDIGFHYIAVNASGQPLDTDGDGLPDYLEDVNGNGSPDEGETSWSGYNSFFGLSGTAALQIFTPLK